MNKRIIKRGICLIFFLQDFPALKDPRQIWFFSNFEMSPSAGTSIRTIASTLGDGRSMAEVEAFTSSLPSPLSCHITPPPQTTTSTSLVVDHRFRGWVTRLEVPIVHKVHSNWIIHK